MCKCQALGLIHRAISKITKNVFGNSLIWIDEIYHSLNHGWWCYIVQMFHFLEGGRDRNKICLVIYQFTISVTELLTFPLTWWSLVLYLLENCYLMATYPIVRCYFVHSYIIIKILSSFWKYLLLVYFIWCDYKSLVFWGLLNLSI